MCGIAGVLFFDRERSVDQQLLMAMCDALRARGPDDSGIYREGPVGLASTRLSIIDLGGGHMPMCNEDATVWISYNGEIYNFQRLRERLRTRHFFRTRTDTEVILHLYEEVGDEFVNELRGMFAIAIWDQRRRRLILARDHVGVKPLFYAHLSDRLLFGSEIKALLCDGILREVDPQALHDYLSLGYVPGPRTMLKSVRKLLPGHLLIAHDNGKVDEQQFWEVPEQHVLSGARSLSAVEEELEDRLKSTVREAMVSDVPIGVFLSGGIDSSLMVAMMSSVSDRPVKTFSVGFDDKSYSELPYARLVAEHFRTDHQEIEVHPSAAGLISSLAAYCDEPFADNSAIGIFAVSEAASRHVKVAISGDGGDEIFGGYYTYQADKLARLYRRLPSVLGRDVLPRIAKALPTSFRKASFDFKLKRFVAGATETPIIAHYLWKAFLTEDMKSGLYGNSYEKGCIRPTHELFQQYYECYPTTDLVNRMLFVDSKIQLADDMLTKVDRMSMANSLEVRVPFLDQQLIRFMFALPGHYKVRGLTLKYLLKRIAERILPRAVVHRPKAGFTVPIARWISHDLRDLVADQLSPRTVRSQGFFDPRQVWALLESHWSRRADCARAIWALVMFGMWWDRYICTRQRTFGVKESAA